MAEVYRAWDVQRKIWCAAKVLKAGLEDPRAERRFLDEAAILIRLDHKHVIRGLQVSRLEDGRPYLVMEIADGGTLQDRVQQHGPMPPRLALDAAIQICKGLNAAHELKVIHRDVNPRNVLVDRKGQCKVSDFGIARLPRADGGIDAPVVHKPHTTSALGTFGYMAPEAHEPERVDPRTDVYGVGATLYHLLTGRTRDSLFMADQAPEILDGVPEVIRPVLVKSVKYRPDERIGTVKELWQKLHELVSLVPEDPPGTRGLAAGLPPEPPPPDGELELVSVPPRRGRPVSPVSSLPPREVDSTGPVAVVREERREPSLPSPLPVVGRDPQRPRHNGHNGVASTPVQPARRGATPEGNHQRKRRPPPARISDVDLPLRPERTRVWVVLAAALIGQLAAVGAVALWVQAAAGGAIGRTEAFQGGVYSQVVVVDQLAELGADRTALERSYDQVARADAVADVMAHGTAYVSALERVRERYVDAPFDREETDVVNKISTLRNALAAAEEAHASWRWRASTLPGRLVVAIWLAPAPVWPPPPRE